MQLWLNNRAKLNYYTNTHYLLLRSELHTNPAPSFLSNINARRIARAVPNRQRAEYQVIYVSGQHSFFQLLECLIYSWKNQDTHFHKATRKTNV
jgi:hypothetical protein